MKKATISEVARRAGVSPTTVSRWLNGAIQLPPATAERISDAVRDLDYRPNAQARRLSTGRAEAIGIVVPDISNPFFALIAGEAEAVALAAGFDLVIWSSRNRIDRELACFDRLASGFIDGLMLITNHEDDGQLAAQVNRHRSRLVIVDEDVRGAEAPKFFVENETGGYEATQMLLALGHRHIAHMGGPRGVMSAIERANGWRRALAEAGIVAADDWHVFTDYEVEPATAAAAKIFDSPPWPTAIFAGSDAIAIGVMTEAKARQISIPGDMSLVGFDGLPIVEVLGPSLSSVAQPIDRLGRLAAERLVSMIGGSPFSEDVVRLPVKLVARASAAPLNTEFGPETSARWSRTRSVNRVRQ